MPAQGEVTRSVREAVGVFHSIDDLEAAIDELESAGFDRSELSLLAASDTVEEKLGHIYEKVSELEDDPEVPRTAFVSTEAVGDAEGALIGGFLYVGAVATAGAVVATGGTLAAAIGAAIVAGGAGGVIGGVLAKFIDNRHANHLQEQLDRGGLLLWVHARDTAHESRATAILAKHAAGDVHIHELLVQA